jgi:hypothetical protein
MAEDGPVAAEAKNPLRTAQFLQPCPVFADFCLSVGCARVASGCAQSFFLKLIFVCVSAVAATPIAFSFRAKFSHSFSILRRRSFQFFLPAVFYRERRRLFFRFFAGRLN